MNIIDAIKSGKPYKRKGVHGDFYKPDYSDGFCVESIIADDWEIEDKKVEITKTQFWDAYVKAKKEYGCTISSLEFAKDIARILGLE